jgi:hypothetical protein
MTELRKAILTGCLPFGVLFRFRNLVIRSGSVVNIAASLVSETIVRSQLPFQLPIIMRACRRPIASICRRSGRRTVHVDAKLVYPRRSPSKPSRRSRLSPGLHPP